MKKIRTLSLLLMSMALISFVLNSCKTKTGQKEQVEEEIIEEVGPNILTQEEIDGGWVLLFDGETTTGWRGYNKPAFPDSGWDIEEAALHCLETGTGEAGMGGDIIYDKEFSNFHLKFEWKIGTGGNSGVFYLGKEVEGWPIWKTAPEMQILDNEVHPDAMLGKDGNRQAGSLYDLIPAVPQNAKPAGEWNIGEILVYDGTVVHFMNGEKVLEYHLWTEDWYAMVKNSKFPEYQENWAEVAKAGLIALQDHGHAVWYRSITIKEL
ncbi:MAG: DUF1080 domain-containing protein [Bacteroidales bacterium]|nr:DUF1080 domain-containing protein [Bacteroidales bacterium]